jgi:hypothetical protein
MKRFLVFSEYRIKEERRTDYLHLVADIKNSLSGLNLSFHVHEGSEQPGLFVESFQTDDIDQAKKWMDERELGLEPYWRRLGEYVEGGQDKIRFWMFEKTV